ncbi:MAG: hypothetical protein M1331_03045 [Candidatus Marsarchaeota archaeon]|nr:hypothetical protein [Candidatus Marsarchaeota archaeon]
MNSDKVTNIRDFQRKGLTYGSISRLARQWGCTQFEVIEKIMKTTGIYTFEGMDKVLSAAERKKERRVQFQQ